MLRFSKIVSIIAIMFMVSTGFSICVNDLTYATGTE